MGEGTIFTGVCHSFCPRGRGVWYRGIGVCGIEGGVCQGVCGGVGGCLDRQPTFHKTATVAVGTHPTGMQSCLSDFWD